MANHQRDRRNPRTSDGQAIGHRWALLREGRGGRDAITALKLYGIFVNNRRRCCVLPRQGMAARGSWMSPMSGWRISRMAQTRLARILIVSVVVLVSSAASVAARRHWRDYHRAIEGIPQAAESYVPGSLERGRYGGRYNRYDRRRLPMNILALVPMNWRKQPADPSLREHQYVSPEGDASIAFSSRSAEERSPDAYL